MGNAGSSPKLRRGPSTSFSKKSLAPPPAAASVVAMAPSPSAIDTTQLKVDVKADLRFLFVVFDAGESNLLIQTVELLAALGEAAGEVAVLALGAPSDNIFAGKPYLYTLPSLGITTPARNGRQDPSRSQRLSDDEMSRITQRWPSVQCVVAGMAYSMQAQVTAAWPDAHKIGVQDNWAKWSDDSLAGRFFVEPKVANHYLMPSPIQCDGLLKRHPNLIASAVGHPALLDWRMAAGNVGLVRRCCRALYGSDKPGVLFCGGYGEGHAETLRTFCEAALQRPQVAFAYAPHPGPGREGLAADRELIASLNCTIGWVLHGTRPRGRANRAANLLQSIPSLLRRPPLRQRHYSRPPAAKASSSACLMLT